MCFDSSEVKGSALTKLCEQKSSSENTVREAVSGLLFSQAQVPVPGLTSLEERGKKKSAGAKWQTETLCACM